MLVRVFKDGRPQQQVFILIEQRSLVERCWERPSRSQVVCTLSLSLFFKSVLGLSAVLPFSVLHFYILVRFRFWDTARARCV